MPLRQSGRAACARVRAGVGSMSESDITVARRRRDALAQGSAIEAEIVDVFEDLPDGDASRYFILGVEYGQIRAMINDGWTGTRPVHAENAGRLRAFLERIGKDATIAPHVGYGGCETWVEIEVRS